MTVNVSDFFKQRGRDGIGVGGDKRKARVICIGQNYVNHGVNARNFPDPEVWT